MKILDNKQGRTLCNEINNRIDKGTVLSLSTGMFTLRSNCE
jgi:uncharacterized protein YlaI